MEKEKEKIRVIHVFDNQDDVINEIRSCEDHETPISLGEIDFLMNVADLVCNFMLLYGSGEISKDELDLYLGQKDHLTDGNPTQFNFLFGSTINGLFYTNWHYNLDEKDLEDAYSAIVKSYTELSILYSFDRIICQMQKMVTDFTAAHEGFDKMTKEERLDRFWAWQDNKDYMKNDFFEKHLDKCRTIYTILNHEHRSKKGGH